MTKIDNFISAYVRLYKAQYDRMYIDLQKRHNGNKDTHQYKMEVQSELNLINRQIKPLAAAYGISFDQAVTALNERNI